MSWSSIEIALLRDLAGKVPARQLALVLGRTIGAVRYRLKVLGLTNYQHGEYHWNAKLSNTVAGMIGALYDAGYTPREIERVITREHSVSYGHIQGIAQCRERRGQAA